MPDIVSAMQPDVSDSRAQLRKIPSLEAGSVVEVATRMLNKAKRSTHPLEHHASFRAVIAAAPSVAELARQLRDDGRDLVSTLAIACGDLAHGFASPPGSRARVESHHRAWRAVRDLDRSVMAARINRRAPSRLLARAQRAIDRADVMIAALPGVVPE